MKILVVNDDGITAPGIWAAARALRLVGEVVVVAPDRQQSGVGASLTLHAPVKADEWTVAPEFQNEGNGLYPVSAFSVEGTPGDSCILALETLVKHVDLVVSGINAGSNVGWDVLVSGTVGGAVQGFIRGINTIAISVAAVTQTKYDVAEKILKPLAEKFEDYSGDTLFLNVNIPKIEMAEVAGVRVTHLGGRSWAENVRAENVGPEKRYWISRNKPSSETPAPDSDIAAIKNNCVSITPLHIGLGNANAMPGVEALLGDIPQQMLDRPD
ncbi:MAG: 5'/3'-nucleotidase SurE [Chloroflexota bacterium]|uniref:Survival protein SurE-like phosphatase/nucleotidase domain-containing protein n=1 Tax=marine metagenome TaxID=408172 RepID=A0A381NI69_9ZZZZ|nr:5'/3'-nucleotidase SurE [Acidobacteriota bacterium]MEC8856548.1 5'/3'-nucleotidase SurE [Chloroflexota bacterium]